MKKIAIPCIFVILGIALGIIIVDVMYKDAHYNKDQHGCETTIDQIQETQTTINTDEQNNIYFGYGYSISDGEYKTGYGPFIGIVY